MPGAHVLLLDAFPPLLLSFFQYPPFSIHKRIESPATGVTYPTPDLNNAPFSIL